MIVTRPIAAVEVGGSGTQTVVFDDGQVRIRDGVHVPDHAVFGVAVPGRVDDRARRVTTASTLGWSDVDPLRVLDIPRPAVLLCNDAGAAGLGEWVLRRRVDEALVYVGLGTGVGGARVHGGHLVADNLFGHQPGFGARLCTCGGTGCLETVAAGWALPAPLDDRQLADVATATAGAITGEPAAADGVIVVGGGLARRYPRIIELMAEALPGRLVVPSSRPPAAKSAAGWGVLELVRRSGAGRLELIVLADPDACASTAAERIAAAAGQRNPLRLGVATGSTPLPTYRHLGRRGVDLSRAEIFLLDEYVGLPPGSPQRYLGTVRRVLGDLAGVRPEQVVGPDVDADDLASAADAYDRRIGAGLDLQLLGLGRNGHIGFNEPGAAPDSTTRVVRLAASTRVANARFFHGREDAVPRLAMTQGIATILRAGEIVVVVTGAAKADALRGLIEGPIGPRLPATALANHTRTTVIADEGAASLLAGG